MATFESVHADAIIGKLDLFDRMLFKGYLGLWDGAAFERLLNSQHVLLEDFGAYVKKTTSILKEHLAQIAQRSGRPLEYLPVSMTANKGRSKEDLARSIAERDGITEGLIAVLSTVEPCQSFDVRWDPKQKRLAAVRRPRKGLHYYLYFIDREMGFMHVRLQTWWPFVIQVYVNGREWLCRRLDEKGIRYRRYDNALVEIDDVEAAQELCERFAHRNWPRLLNALARRVNPLLAVVEAAGFGGYYWVTDQAELATDVMFRSRAALLEIMPDLYEAAVLLLSSEDVLRFLGRKLHPSFQGEVVGSDKYRRPEGRRVKHRVRRNSIKMYDKYSVLRIETTINNPGDFKVLEGADTRHGRSPRWVPMTKGVSNLWRYWQVCEAANQRYLEAMANVTLKGEAVRELDGLCRSHTVSGRHVARLSPIGPDDCRLFQAVLHGEHLVRGLRNGDLTALLYPKTPRDDEELRRRCTRTSRAVAKLRGHGLLAKIPRSYRYRITPRGARLMSAAIRVRLHDFPKEPQAA